MLNALYAHRAALREIHSETPGIDHPTLVVGLIKGGINTNVVPDKVSLRLDRRVVPEENPQDVLKQLNALIVASVGAFFITQHLKVTTPLIASAAKLAMVRMAQSHHGTANKALMARRRRPDSCRRGSC